MPHPIGADWVRLYLVYGFRSDLCIFPDFFEKLWACLVKLEIPAEIDIENRLARRNGNIDTN
jgi:hypothetical protein